MSRTYENCKVVSLHAGADLRNAIGSLLAINNTGRVILATAATGAVGVLAMNPEGSRTDIDGTEGTAIGEATTGKIVSVALIGAGGIMSVRAGAVITAGQLVTVDATAGRAAGDANIAAIAADQMAVGAADGEFFRMLAQPFFESA